MQFTKSSSRSAEKTKFMNDVIYLDNAATTMMKPASVVKAVSESLTTFGGPGRGVHAASLASTMAVFKCRGALAKLFNATAPEQVSLTCNATESLNIAIEGLLKPGDHVITTMASHNSVLRPLYRKNARDGVDLTIVDIEGDGSLDIDKYKAAFKPNTKWVVVAHSSNLTGDIYDIEKLGKFAHEHGAKMIVDAAQTGGVLDIDVQAQNIDVLCLTGHKSLYGPQGTGAIIVNPEIAIPSYKVGGSGMHSYDHEHPSFMPDALEAGTLNAHGAAGLCAGVEFIIDKTPRAIKSHIDECISRFEEGIKDAPQIRFYGGSKQTLGRCGISAINIGNHDSAEVADILSTEYNICVRPGAHCAPKMHEALSTIDQGIVRFGFCSFSTFEEVDIAIRAIREIATRFE